MRADLSANVQRLHHIPRALRIVWEATGKWTIAWILLLIIQGLIPAGIVYLTRFLVDGLTAVVVTGTWESLRPVLIPAILMGLLMLLSLIIDNGLSWVRTVQAELIGDYIAALIHRKSADVDIAFYEMAEFHDHLQRARDDAFYLPLRLLESIGEVLQSTITLLAMVALLIPYGLWLPLALVISTLPALLIVIRNHGEYHRWWEATTADRRWASYYDTILTFEDTAAEVRLFGLGAHFLTAYQLVRRSLREGRLEVAKRQGWSRFAAGVLALLISAGTGVVVLWRAIQGLYTLGDLALMYQAFDQGQGLLRSLLGSVGQIYRHMLFLENLFKFLDLEKQVADPTNPKPVPIPLCYGIQFRNVTFYYPGSERSALVNFNLTIPAGKTVAIVGENGAGKSTLVKLLCRFYDPQEGTIKFDGIDLRQMALDDLRSSLSVMFQRPVPYHDTAAGNIGVGMEMGEQNLVEIERAAKAAGAHDIISLLPKGYETLLGKWFVDGTGLSWGEWQRIALARAFLRRSEIMILDEPTSSMDSWAEAEWLDRFRRFVTGRTAMVITHRFTTAMRADVIHVMKEGEIIETGSHKELLALDGFYATSWRQQVTDTVSVTDLLDDDARPLRQSLSYLATKP
jgi:ATP-binding cassette subfamily B protein